MYSELPTTATSENEPQPIHPPHRNAMNSRNGTSFSPYPKEGAKPPASSGTPQSQRKKTNWSGPMESLAMDLYIKAVELGKRSDSGFKSETHRSIATEINAIFPHANLDGQKVKSKLSQSFKKDYDAFVACRDASGFGWDDLTCEVTAADDVWENYLKSHPNARKFQGTPFPEWRKLDIIFGSHSATGRNAQSSSMVHLDNAPTEPIIEPVIEESQSNNLEPAAAGYSTSATAVSQTPNISTSRTSHNGRGGSHLIANAINNLVGYLQHNRERRETLPARHLSARQEAISLFQDEHASKASQHEALEAFKVFKSEINAQIFVGIKDKELRLQWLNQEIAEMNYQSH